VNVLKYILGFPGMKVLQFTPLKDAFVEGDMNMVLYSGTHDNDTLVGWYKSTILSGEDCGHEQEEQMVRIKGACNRLIEDLYMSRATWVITPMQDILGLDSEARMNVPGTISGNWQWTLNKELLTAKVKKWLYSLAKDSNRLP
jgi:4-alpha-glucanotransferase